MSLVPSRPPAFPVSPVQLTLVVVCVVSIYFVIAFYGKSLDSYRINQRAAQVRREIARLEAENRQLEAKAASLATDAYVETAARDKLNLARPGDRSIIVLPAPSEPAGVEGPPREGPRVGSEFGHLADWLALFFGPR